MDSEKVIVEIEDALSGNLAKAGHVYRLSLNGLKDKALIDALALLKEQEAVKPFIQISEHTGKKWLTCGACEYPIESEKDSWEEVNFCPKCGRPVLWEGR